MKPTSFQKKSAEHIIKHLFGNGSNNSSTDRFLLADEPGMGKTIVASEVIRHVFERNKDENKPSRVIYICSNMGIIEQNVRRLMPENSGEWDKEIGRSRLTMWPLHLGKQNKNDLQIISFTPNTNLFLNRSIGIWEERRYLFSIIKEVFGYNSTDNLREIFRGTVGGFNYTSRASEEWQHRINLTNDIENIDKSIIKKYNKYFKDKFSIDYIDELKNISKYKHDESVRHKINSFLHEGRTLLAKAALDILNPDLIILDEFQKFREVLDEADKQDSIIEKLFNKEKSKILCLSATPYKMYTTWNEAPTEDHYSNFIDTMKFLVRDKEETDSIKSGLNNYRKELFSISSGSFDSVLKSKSNIETLLKKRMIRTERISFTEDTNGNLHEVIPDSSGKYFLDKQKTEEHNSVLVSDESVRQINNLMISSYANHFPCGTALSYIKSGSFLPHIMKSDEYQLVRDLGHDHSIWSENFTDIVEPLNERSYGNHQINYLIDLFFNKWQMHRKLWIKPSLAYTGCRNKCEYNGKMLIFSKWRFVPRYISFMMSMEALRRMDIEAVDQEKESETKTQSSMLNFSPERYSTFNVSYPSYFLSQIITSKDYIYYSADITGGGNRDFNNDLFIEVKKRIQNQLGKLRVKITGDGRHVIKDFIPRMIMLDKLILKDIEFSYRMSGVRLSSEDEGDNGYKNFAEEIDQYIEENELSDLSFSDSDIDMLAEICIKSPAVSFVRAVLSEWNLKTDKLQSDIDQVLLAFCQGTLRRFFNRSYARKIIREEKGDGTAYWRDVLNYCFKEDWQAVIDEYVYILSSEYGLNNRKGFDDFSEKIIAFIEELETSMGLRPGPLTVRINSYTDKIVSRLFALSYEDESTESGEDRKENIRKSFNSPFWPFIVATTSIGQEGIDFHRYCHDVMHWNLPSNPVDLEQREGRVDRYNGLVVRRNIASYFEENIGDLQMQSSLWHTLLKNAAIVDKDNPLSPNWIFKNNNLKSWSIRRHVVTLPFSRDRKEYIALKKTLAMYRIAFGQPRQADLLDKLKLHENLNNDQIKQLFINLQP